MSNSIHLKKIIYSGAVAAIAILLTLSSSKAGDVSSAKDLTDTSDTHYGLFNWLDHRSQYGQGVFPEPFLVDDSDMETNEFRMDWLHTKNGSSHTDLFTGEVEKSFGIVTLEIEVPFEHDHDGGAGVNTEGFADVDLGARLPIYQYVSRSGFVDNTVGFAIEVGIPTDSKLSHDTEIVPKVFDDLRLGEHFTVQSIFGYSQLLGPDDGGLSTFEYGFVFGYTIPHKELPLPGVQQLIPVFELSGETELNKDEPGHNSLTGNIAVRFNMDAIGPIQPRLGVGFVFPVDKGAREDTRCGIYTSLVFEY